MARKRVCKLISSTGDKKGLSTMVVTVLIIGLVIVALGIVWQIVSGILKSSQEDVDFSQSKINLKISAVFVDSSSVLLKINRLTGPGDMNGLNFIFSDGVSSEIVRNISPLEELEEKTFSLVLDKLKYQNLKTVSIAPMVILSSGKERVGNILDTYTIKSGNYNESFYGPSPGAEECDLDTPCRSDFAGDKVCNLTTGNISINWHVFSCTWGRCIDNIDVRPFESCLSDGCYVGNATCKSYPECTSLSDCREAFKSFAFCDDITGDVYEFLTNYSCDSGNCLEDTSKNLVHDCLYGESAGCIPGIPGTDADCNWSLECDNNEDCDTDGAIAGLDFCFSGEEVWMKWKDNYCSATGNHMCEHNIIDKPKEDCSEKEGNWSCLNGECIEYIECTQDSHCNPEGTCGKRCVDQKCVVENPVNSGIVASIWPPDMSEYFDSSSLPTVDADYVDNFAKFTSGNEERCLLVKEHVYPTLPGANAYLRFDVKMSSVAPGDSYEVWETRFNCECV